MRFQLFRLLRYAVKAQGISKNTTGKTVVINASYHRCKLAINVPQGKKESEVLLIHCI